MTTSALIYPHETPPGGGETIAVAPGVLWLRMPLPFALDHVNLWLLEDGDAWTAVDTGIALDTVRECWQRVLADKKLARCIATHFHPDHLGLAAWLQQQTGAPLWMTAGEYLTGLALHGGIGSFAVGSMLDFFRAHGLDETRLAALAARGNAYRRGVPEVPATFRPMRGDERITIGRHDWQVQVGLGHSPEHAGLYAQGPGVLISGDMLLPRISTNISVWSVTPEANPLARFLESIDRLRQLPEDTLVLPSHGRPFRGLHARVAQLETHHRERCAELLAACARPRTAAELLPVLFAREIGDAHQTMFAMGEAIAHLNYLEQARQLERVTENGTIRFVRN